MKPVSTPKKGDIIQICDVTFEQLGLVIAVQSVGFTACRLVIINEPGRLVLCTWIYGHDRIFLRGTGA